MPQWLSYLLLFNAAFGALYILVALAPLIRSFPSDGFPLTLVSRDFANVWMAAQLSPSNATMDLFA